MSPVRVVDTLPAFDICLASVDLHLSLKAGLTLRITGSTLLKTFASRFQGLTGLPQPEANRGSVPFDQFTDEMEQVGHAQASQSRFTQFDQGLGSVADQIEDPCAKRLEPGCDPSMPGVIGSISAGSSIKR